MPSGASQSGIAARSPHHLRLIAAARHMGNRLLLPVAVSPHRLALQNAFDKRADGHCFFGRAILIAVVDDRKVAQTPNRLSDLWR
jgi:hypothetical protein